MRNILFMLPLPTLIIIACCYDKKLRSEWLFTVALLIAGSAITLFVVGLLNLIGAIRK